MASYVVVRVGGVQSGGSRKRGSGGGVTVMWLRLQLNLQLRLLLLQLCSSETENSAAASQPINGSLTVKDAGVTFRPATASLLISYRLKIKRASGSSAPSVPQHWRFSKHWRSDNTQEMS